MRSTGDARVDEDVATAGRTRISRFVGHERGPGNAAERNWSVVSISFLEVRLKQLMKARLPDVSQSLTGSSAMLQYPTFSVTYESGIDNVPRFDAHIEVYSMMKSVRVVYDTPYIKGLPVTMIIRENVDGVYKESMVRRTYEDPYTLEMKELYEMVVNSKEVKTTAKDAKMDLKIFQMIMKAGQR